MSLSVLHVSQPTDGGVARYVTDLARDHVRSGWTVAVACPSTEPLAVTAAREGASVVRWEASRDPGASIVGETARLARIVRALRPDLVHLHSSKAGVAGRLAIRRRIPTVFQPHAWSFEATRGGMRALAIAWERSAVHLADVVVCVSTAERERGERSGIRARYVVVPNGVDLTRFETLPSREEARRRLGLADGPLVVCVGRLSEQKGQDVLLDAWPAVLQTAPDARVVLVGDGPERNALERRAVAAASLIGGSEDVPTWLAAANVVVAPSRWEGMSLTVLEAMAAERSVVAADVPGMSEALDGAGAIVPPGDHRALSRAILERLLDPERAAVEGAAGLRRIVERFTLERVFAGIRDAYASILPEAAPIASPSGSAVRSP